MHLGYVTDKLLIYAYKMFYIYTFFFNIKSPKED